MHRGKARLILINSPVVQWYLEMTDYNNFVIKVESNYGKPRDENG